MWFWLHLLSVGASQAGPFPSLTNGDFESGAPGQAPAGWAVSTEGDATTEVEVHADGRQAVRLTRGRLFQVVPADAFAGHRVRLSMQAHPDLDSVGQISLVARSRGQTVWRATVRVRDPGWSPVHLDAELPPGDDLELEVSVRVLSGPGLVVDAASLTDLGPLEALEAAALDPEAAARIASFAQLYSHARWFHPSDEAQAADWDAIAERGVTLAMQASSSDALAQSWSDLLQPVAPTLQVWSGPAPPPTAVPTGSHTVGWYHLGPGVSLAATDPQSVRSVHGVGSTFRRFRIDDAGQWWSSVHRTVSLTELDAQPWQGETVRLSVDARVDGALDASVHLSVAGDTVTAQTPSLRDGPTDLLLAVPATAETLSVALELTGPGAVEITQLQLSPVRPSPLRSLTLSMVVLSTYSALFGSLALTSALLTRRTIGGFIITVVAVVGMLQLGELDPTMARGLPLPHIRNIDARLFEDARDLARVTETMGRPVRLEASVLAVLAWIMGLLALGAFGLRSMDIRGGGD